MTHLRDLDSVSYHQLGPNARPIGWLEHGHPFPRGETSHEFRKALLRLLSFRIDELFCLGLHWCSLCEAQGRNGPDARSSQWAVLVPAPDCVYEAPSWIGHYVLCHKYLPPECFREAVMACPVPGEKEYVDAIERRVTIPFADEMSVSRVHPRWTVLRSGVHGRMPANHIDPIMWRSVEDIDVGAEIASRLLAGKISCVGQLIQKTEADLWQIAHLDNADIRAVVEALAAQGLVLNSRITWPIPPFPAETF